MPLISIVNRAGELFEVRAQAGLSVMEVIRENGFDELLALCGGCCSCATCHVYVDPDSFGELPPMSVDEDDLLDCSDHRTGFSRLSCQLPVAQVPEGLRVRIAPED